MMSLLHLQLLHMLFQFDNCDLISIDHDFDSRHVWRSSCGSAEHLDRWHSALHFLDAPSSLHQLNNTLVHATTSSPLTLNTVGHGAYHHVRNATMGLDALREAGV